MYGALPVCVSMHTVHSVARREYWIPDTGVADGCEPPWEYWELKQSVLLTIEISLQPPDTEHLLHKKLRLSYVLGQQSKLLEKWRIFSFLFLSKYNQYKIRTNLINAWSSYSLNIPWKEEYVRYWVPGTGSEINVYNMCVYKNLQLLFSCWNVLRYLHAG